MTWHDRAQQRRTQKEGTEGEYKHIAYQLQKLFVAQRLAAELPDHVAHIRMTQSAVLEMLSIQPARDVERRDRRLDQAGLN